MFAGLNFSLEESTDLGLADALMFYNSSHWVNYVHSLVTHMYGDANLAGSIRDSLSPFQVVSKRWTTLATRLLDKERDFVVIGSWFGQLVPLLSDEDEKFKHAKCLLIDKDSRACAISSQLLGDYPNVAHGCLDVFELTNYVFRGRTVIWPGLEHFDKTETKELVESLRGTGTAFILLSTDRPDVDHVALCSSVEELSQYFHTEEVLFKGTLRTREGNRFMVVARN